MSSSSSNTRSSSTNEGITPIRNNNSTSENAAAASNLIEPSPTAATTNNDTDIIVISTNQRSSGVGLSRYPHLLRQRLMHLPPPPTALQAQVKMMPTILQALGLEEQLRHPKPKRMVIPRYLQK